RLASCPAWGAPRRVRTDLRTRPRITAQKLQARLCELERAARDHPHGRRRTQHDRLWAERAREIDRELIERRTNRVLRGYAVRDQSSSSARAGASATQAKACVTTHRELEPDRIY